MTTVWGATSTTDEVLSGINLHGKRVLITGVSAGIGVETARALAAHGAQVVGAARDLAKAKAATAQVEHDAAAHGGRFELVALDLANLQSVRACADELLARGKRFDVVIANAGVMAMPFGHTADGFETQFGTNHLGHFVFVNRIAPLLAAGGRLINLASSGHRFSNVDLNDPNFQHTPYDPFVAYGRSKTANILFAVAFDRRHSARNVRAAAVHPGAIPTELGRHLDPAQFAKLLDQMNQQLAAEGKPPFEFKTIPQGAATSVWAGVVAPAEEIGGRYCVELPCRRHRAGPRADQCHQRRRSRICARSRQRRGTLEQERRTGGRDVLKGKNEMAEATELGGAFTFAGTSLTVHRLGYGAMQLAGQDGDKRVWGPPRDIPGAVTVLREAIASGVNHIDTSDFYGPHVTNQLIRRAMHPYPKDLVIVTKVGARRGADGSWPRARSRQEIIDAVHDNLRNLKLDALQVVNLRLGGFAAPEDEPFEEPLSALAELQQQGLVQHIGLSNVFPSQLEQARKITAIVLHPEPLQPGSPRRRPVH